jgi:hypothetical protein
VAVAVVLLGGGVTAYLVSSPPQDQRAPLAVGPHAADFAAWWKDCAPHWDHDVCNPVPAGTLTFCNALLPPGLPHLTHVSVDYMPFEPWPTTNPYLTTYDGGLIVGCGTRVGDTSWDVSIRLPSKNRPISAMVTSDPCSQPGGQCVTTGSGKLNYNSYPDRTIIQYGSAAVSLWVYTSMPDKSERDIAALALFANVARAMGVTGPDLGATTPTTAPNTAAPPTTLAAGPVSRR